VPIIDGLIRRQKLPVVGLEEELSSHKVIPAMKIKFFKEWIIILKIPVV
jgi:hypothetical protein